MRPLTFILILTLTTAAIILVCSFVDRKYGSSSYLSSSSSSPSAEPLTSNHGAEKYTKSGQKPHPMKAKAEKKHEAGKKFLSIAEGKVPAFQDVFDEETFYIFAGCVALGSVVLAFIGSRFLTLSDPDDPDEILKRVRKWKIKHTEHGHPIMDDDAAASGAAAGDSSSNAVADDESADSKAAKDAKERSFLDYTDDDDEDDDYDSEGDDSEEERELLRRVEEKFFRDRRQQANVEATMG